ncbi:MAG TPA: glycosyltransferase family 4 protein [Longilinea sp.]|nr:glycosyltransferase family 4 protein [Longilinea sp.]
MHIAVFHNVPSGGAKRALFEWVRRLSLEHAIDVYSLSTADHDYCDLRPYTGEYHIVNFTPLPLARSPFGRINQFQRWRDLERLQAVYRNLASQIDAGGYDVVFSNACMFTFIPILQIYLHTPTLYYLHEHFANRVHRVMERPYLKQTSVRQVLDRIDPLIALYYGRLADLQRAAVKKTNRLIANSQFTQHQFETDLGVPAPVVLYGVNSTDFHPRPVEKQPGHVLSVGELSPRKGFDFLVESLALVPREKRPILRLACNNQIAEERVFIENLAALRGVRLEILANLNSQQLALEYNRAQLCVYSPVQEPFGLVPLESMACGTPVLGVAEGGVRESVLDGVTGRLTPRDPRLFAAAVVELLDNPQELRRLGDNGLSVVREKWTWEGSTGELERHLLAVAGNQAV